MWGTIGNNFSSLCHMMQHVFTYVAVEVLGASTRVGHRSVHRHSDT